MTNSYHLKTAHLLIRKATICWPGSEHDGMERDLSIKDGIIERIGERLGSGHEQIELEHQGVHLSPGWLDLNADFRDPGSEEKEDLRSGIHAAMFGGYTRALIMPSTSPAIDHRGAVEDLKARSQGFPFTLCPSGCISQKREGKDIAELYDMKRSGALAFTDGRSPITDAGLLSNALWYAKSFGAHILLYPDDPTISRYGVMHEGELSIRLGMKGIPTISERIAVDRALHLLAYTDGQLHFSTISSAEALESIREAKKNGLRVSCDVSAHHLFFDESRLKGFSSLFKIMPPLRDQDHVEALKKGVADGTIDHICSLHEPQAEENKRVEFEVADHGMPGLETCFGAARKAMGDRMSIGALTRLFSERPRSVMGLGMPPLQEGEALEATLFDPDREWTCKKEELRSKAYGNPYVGEELKGKAIGTVHQGLYQPIDG